jgi:ATP-dependent Zn protease
MRYRAIQEYLPSISEEMDELFEELLDIIINEEQETIQEYMDKLSKQYDILLEKEFIENQGTIGYCGFICDNECSYCKDTGTFDIADEV